ncbi:MAG TPA: hypothetical protein VE617_01860 [Propionibacteriaceae bacterium]|nr:hypothetical protein [Propionibacteriaceae bacterium]
MPDPINAGAIPGANLRPDMVEIAATEMSGIGDQVGTQAATVVSTWQRLSGHYDAPEDTTLFGVMDPVKTHGETFDANIGKVSAALHTYAAEVEPIKAELARIKTEAYTFLSSIAGGVEKTSYSRAGAITSTVEWHEDQDTVDANNALIGRVNDQMELLWAAERKCANAIYDIIGFPHIAAASDANPNGYGVEDIPEGAETPWGTTVERTESCGEKAVGAVKGFVWDGLVVDGLGGTVVGLGTLVLGYNPQTGEWFSGDAYGAAWSNLGMLGVGLATAGPLSTPLIMGMPGPVGDFLRRGQETLLNAGKGLIAWDTWSEDPARAAGATVFNLGTILIPVGAATAPVRASASTAAAAIRATARVVNVLDPATLIARGGGAAIRITMPSVGDALRAVDLGPATRIDIPDLPPTRTIDVPTVGRADTTVDTPRVDGDVDVPVRSPEDSVSVPVREPELVGVGGRPGEGGGTTVGGDSGGGGTGGTAAGGGTGGGGDLPPGSGSGTDTSPGLGPDRQPPTGGAVPGDGSTGTIPVDADAPYGRAPDGRPLTADEFDEGYVNPDGTPNYGDGSGGTVTDPPPGTIDEAAPGGQPGTTAPDTDTPTTPGDADGPPATEPVAPRSESARPTELGQPVIGATDDGPGTWTEMNRSGRGMPDQEFATGIDRLPNGHPVEYIVPRPGATAVEFDGYYRHGHPPVEVYQEVKGDYSVIERFQGEQGVQRQLDKWVRDAARQRTAIDDGATLEWIFTRNEDLAIRLQDLLDDAGIDVNVRYVPRTP